MTTLPVTRARVADRSATRTALPLTLLLLVSLVLYAVRLHGPPDLMDGAQHRTAAYILDITVNGNWLVQHDVHGNVASKPPLFNWLAAIVTLATGQATRLSITLVSALSMLGLAVTVFLVGRARFGEVAGLLAALMVLLSYVGVRHVALARPDALFALLTALAGFAAFAAWNTGRGWTRFWIACAGATLAKGPLVLLIAPAGLLGALWERRSGAHSIFRAKQLLGVAILIGIVSAWFIAALAHLGPALVEKLIADELVGHAVNPSKGGVAHAFYKPPLYLFSRFFPWSVLTCIAVWIVVTRPSSDPTTRRFERFLCCWMLGGLFVFALGAHQRADHILPLVAPAALLAGRQLQQMISRMRPSVVAGGAGAVFVITITLVMLGYWNIRGQRPLLEVSTEMSRLASAIRAEHGRDFPFTHVDSPFALQFYLNTMRRHVSHEHAAELLRGDSAAFVIVRDIKRLRRALGPDAPIHVLAGWPDEEDALVRIVSNHPRLEWTDRIAATIGRVELQTDGLQPQLVGERRIVFTSQGQAELRNDSERTARLQVEIRGENVRHVEQITLGPGETWGIDFDDTPVDEDGAVES